MVFFCQKLLIQEKAAQEVKLAIKPFYQNKDITKEEYKEIVRKAVDKVSDLLLKHELRVFQWRLAWVGFSDHVGAARSCCEGEQGNENYLSPFT